MAGSTGNGSATSSIEALDVSTLQWSAVTSMPTARSGLAAVTGPDGLIYVAGGFLPDGGPTGAFEAYDTVVGGWYSLPPLPTPRAQLAGALGDNGISHFLGGTTSDCVNPESPLWPWSRAGTPTLAWG